MHQLGISLYPEHSTPEKDLAYMELAAKYGFKRIFTCLLSVDKPKEEMIAEFGAFMDNAHRLGFKVAVDTNPQVFSHLGASPTNLKPFADMKVDIIRLDLSFGLAMDAAITRNPYGIQIEFNGSMDPGVGTLLENGANKDQMIICHNFFPQRYTGLGWELFMSLNRRWKGMGLHTAAFISSNEEGTFGPWPVFAGLPTCEVHRGKPVDMQVRHLLACGLVDDILFGNAYASEEELKAVSEVCLSKVTLKPQCCEDLSPLEEEILYGQDHAGRVDAPDYMIRSAYPRLFCRDKSIPPRSCSKPVFERGDVLMVNDNLAHYRGEVQVVLQPMANDGERNLLGHLNEDEQRIMELIKPGQYFGFVRP